MNNITNADGASMFLGNAYGVIDSKIQYLEYKLNQTFEKLQIEGTQKPHSPISAPEVSDSIKESLASIETMNRKVQKLLYFRSKINIENAERASKLFYESKIEDLDFNKIDELV